MKVQLVNPLAGSIIDEIEREHCTCVGCVDGGDGVRCEIHEKCGRLRLTLGIAQIQRDIAEST